MTQPAQTSKQPSPVAPRRAEPNKGVDLERIRRELGWGLAPQPPR